MTPEINRRMDERYREMVNVGPNEQFVCQIRKHPIGALFIYLIGFIITGVLLIVAFISSAFVPHNLAGTNTGMVKVGIIAVGIILAGLSLLVTFISVYIYRNSVILVTNEKMVEVLYKSIFNRTITSASMGEIEDVAVKQDGIFPRLFNYGTLLIETAGETNNFKFDYAPYPYACSKEIVAAHEDNVHRYGN